MNEIKKTELKNRLDKLEELKEIKKFLNDNIDKYTIRIKRKFYFFNEPIVSKRSLEVSKKIMLDIIEKLISYHENDIDKILGDEK